VPTDTDRDASTTTSCEMEASQDTSAVNNNEEAINENMVLSNNRCGERLSGSHEQELNVADEATSGVEGQSHNSFEAEIVKETSNTTERKGDECMEASGLSPAKSAEGPQVGQVSTTSEPPSNLVISMEEQESSSNQHGVVSPSSGTAALDKDLTSPTTTTDLNETTPPHVINKKTDKDDSTLNSAHHEVSSCESTVPTHVTGDVLPSIQLHSLDELPSSSTSEDYAAKPSELSQGVVCHIEQTIRNDMDITTTNEQFVNDLTTAVEDSFVGSDISEASMEVHASKSLVVSSVSDVPSDDAMPSPSDISKEDAESCSIASDMGSSHADLKVIPQDFKVTNMADSVLDEVLPKTLHTLSPNNIATTVDSTTGLINHQTELNDVCNSRGQDSPGLEEEVTESVSAAKSQHFVNEEDLVESSSEEASVIKSPKDEVLLEDQQIPTSIQLQEDFSEPKQSSNNNIATCNETCEPAYGGTPMESKNATSKLLHEELQTESAALCHKQINDIETLESMDMTLPSQTEVFHEPKPMEESVTVSHQCDDEASSAEEVTTSLQPLGDTELPDTTGTLQKSRGDEPSSNDIVSSPIDKSSPIVSIKDNHAGVNSEAGELHVVPKLGLVDYPRSPDESEECVDANNEDSLPVPPSPAVSTASTPSSASLSSLDELPDEIVAGDSVLEGTLPEEGIPDQGNKEPFVESCQTRSSSLEPQVGSPKLLVKSSGPQLKSPEPQLKLLEPQVRSPKPQVRSPEPQVTSPELQVTSPELQVKSLDKFRLTRSSSLEPQVGSPMPQVRSPGPQIRSPEPQVRSPEPEVRSPEPQVRSPEPQVRSPEPQIRLPEPQVRSPELQVRSLEPQVRSPEPQVRSPELKVKSPEPQVTKSRSPIQVSSVVLMESSVGSSLTHSEPKVDTKSPEPQTESIEPFSESSPQLEIKGEGDITINISDRPLDDVMEAAMSSDFQYNITTKVPDSTAGQSEGDDQLTDSDDELSSVEGIEPFEQIERDSMSVEPTTTTGEASMDATSETECIDVLKNDTANKSLSHDSNNSEQSEHEVSKQMDTSVSSLPQYDAPHQPVDDSEISQSGLFQKSPDRVRDDFVSSLGVDSVETGGQLLSENLPESTHQFESDETSPEAKPRNQQAMLHDQEIKFQYQEAESHDQETSCDQEADFSDQKEFESHQRPRFDEEIESHDQEGVEAISCDQEAICHNQETQYLIESHDQEVRFDDQMAGSLNHNQEVESHDLEAESCGQRATSYDQEADSQNEDSTSQNQEANQRAKFHNQEFESHDIVTESCTPKDKTYGPQDEFHDQEAECGHQDAESLNQEARFDDQPAQSHNVEVESPDHKTKADDQNFVSVNQEAESHNQKAESSNQEAESHYQVESCNQEAESHNQETELCNQQAECHNQEAESHNQRAESRNQEAESHNHEVESHIQEADLPTISETEQEVEELQNSTSRMSLSKDVVDVDNEISESFPESSDVTFDPEMETCNQEEVDQTADVNMSSHDLQAQDTAVLPSIVTESSNTNQLMAEAQTGLLETVDSSTASVLYAEAEDKMSNEAAALMDDMVPSGVSHEGDTEETSPRKEESHDEVNMDYSEAVEDTELQEAVSDSLKYDDGELTCNEAASTSEHTVEQPAIDNVGRHPSSAEVSCGKMTEVAEHGESGLKPGELDVELAESTGLESGKSSMEHEYSLRPSMEPGKSSVEPESSLQHKKFSLKPTESDVEPAESSMEPAESSVEPAESSVEPAESSMEPGVEPGVEPESSLQYKESSLKPAESDVEPAESSMEPVESDLEPGKSTQSSLQHNEPSLKPAKSDVEPAESSMEPVEPDLETGKSTQSHNESSLKPDLEPAESSLEPGESPESKQVGFNELVDSSLSDEVIQNNQVSEKPTDSIDPESIDNRPRHVSLGSHPLSTSSFTEDSVTIEIIQDDNISSNTGEAVKFSVASLVTTEVTGNAVESSQVHSSLVEDEKVAQGDPDTSSSATEELDVEHVTEEATCDSNVMGGESEGSDESSDSSSSDSESDDNQSSSSSSSQEDQIETTIVAEMDTSVVSSGEVNSALLVKPGKETSPVKEDISEDVTISKVESKSCEHQPQVETQEVSEIVQQSDKDAIQEDSQPEQPMVTEDLVQKAEETPVKSQATRMPPRPIPADSMETWRSLGNGTSTSKPDSNQESTSVIASTNVGQTDTIGHYLQQYKTQVAQEAQRAVQNDLQKITETVKTQSLQFQGLSERSQYLSKYYPSGGIPSMSGSAQTATTMANYRPVIATSETTNKLPHESSSNNQPENLQTGGGVEKIAGRLVQLTPGGDIRTSSASMETGSNSGDNLGSPLFRGLTKDKVCTVFCFAMLLYVHVCVCVSIVVHHNSI